jgi:pyrroline-5-carboxylate reductase
MKIGFIGGGNMAEAMIKGMTAQGMKDIVVSEPSPEKREHLAKQYAVETTASNRDVTSACDMIILAVKPQNMEGALDEIGDTITDEKTVMSIAAGITLTYLSSRLRTKKLIRVMPNTPALVQEGMSVMSLCECFSGPGLSAARDVLLSIGKVITLPEKQMDAVTALSGSGPAFFAYFIEAMIESGTKMGLSEDDARTLAVQTAIGTAQLLDTGMPPARLREMVTSPGGTTAAGLKAFEDKSFKDVVAGAMEAARRRSAELGKTV